MSQSSSSRQHAADAARTAEIRRIIASQVPQREDLDAILEENFQLELT